MTRRGLACVVHRAVEAATRRETLADCEPVVDDEDVCKSALLEPPLADSEQPAGPLRHRGHGLDGIESERAEPDEASARREVPPASTPSARRETPPSSSISTSPSR